MGEINNMNNRIKAKLNKQFLINSIIESPFIENGFHWTKTQFDAGLKWRECHFGTTDRLVVDAKVNFAVYLIAMFDAPHFALKILESIYQSNPANAEVVSELIECNLELNRISNAAFVFDKLSSGFNGQNSILKYSGFITGDKVWDKYCSSDLSRESIRLINSGEFDLCREFLMKQHGIESEVLKLNLFGAENNHGNFINQLKFLVNNYNDIYRDYKFWFYRTSDAISDPMYWELCDHPSFSKNGVSMKKINHGLEWCLHVQ